MNTSILPNNLSVDNLQFVPLSTHRGFQDLTGVRFTRLLVVGYAGARNGHSRWYCLCDCGNITCVERRSLIEHKTVSCSCFRFEQLAATQQAGRGTHHMSGTKEFRTWCAIRTRCNNPANKTYVHYGGRGIKVCDRWLESFENFFEDMGYAPSSQYTIERVDNDGNYAPDNCVWATNKEQSRNKRSTRYITIEGTTKSLCEWAELRGVDADRIGARINQCKWCESCAVMLPKGQICAHKSKIESVEDEMEMEVV